MDFSGLGHKNRKCDTMLFTQCLDDNRYAAKSTLSDSVRVAHRTGCCATGMQPLYHLVQAPLWRQCKDVGKAYYPPTYEQDGFTHATAEARLLLGVANHFYKEVTCDFLCLVIDPAALSPYEVKFEPAAPVGDIQAHEVNEEKEVILFPHIYGPIPPSAVTRELRVDRGDGGVFLSIEEL